MFRTERSGGMKGISPVRQCLSRQCRDQININVVKSSLPCPLITLQKLCMTVNSSHADQLPVMHGLAADRDPVNPRRAKPVQFLRIQCAGICLNRDLCITLYRKGFPDGIHHPGNLVSRQHRRGSAANEDGRDFLRVPFTLKSIHRPAPFRTQIRPAKPFPCLADLCLQCFQIAFLHVASGRKAQKITVAALADTERDMDV